LVMLLTWREGRREGREGGRGKKMRSAIGRYECQDLFFLKKRKGGREGRIKGQTYMLQIPALGKVLVVLSHPRVALEQFSYFQTRRFKHSTSTDAAKFTHYTIKSRHEFSVHGDAPSLRDVLPAVIFRFVHHR